MGCALCWLWSDSLGGSTGVEHDHHHHWHSAIADDDGQIRRGVDQLRVVEHGNLCEHPGTHKMCTPHSVRGKCQVHSCVQMRTHISYIIMRGGNLAFGMGIDVCMCWNTFVPKIVHEHVHTTANRLSARIHVKYGLVKRASECVFGIRN